MLADIINLNKLMVLSKKLLSPDLQTNRSPKIHAQNGVVKLTYLDERADSMPYLYLPNATKNEISTTISAREMKKISYFDSFDFN